MGKSNRMERRIQGFQDKGSAVAMGWKRNPNWYFPEPPENKDVKRLSEALGRRSKFESLIQQSLAITPDRIEIWEIRGAEEAASFLKVIADGHPGVITTCHAATPDQGFTGMSTICRRHDEYGEEDFENAIFIEDTREI